MNGLKRTSLLMVSLFGCSLAPWAQADHGEPVVKSETAAPTEAAKAEEDTDSEPTAAQRQGPKKRKIVINDLEEL